MITPSSLASPVHVSLGAYGRCTHHVAIAQALTQSPSDPLLRSTSNFEPALKTSNFSLNYRLLEYFREAGGRNAPFNLAPTHQF